MRTRILDEVSSVGQTSKPPFGDSSRVLGEEGLGCEIHDVEHCNRKDCPICAGIAHDNCT